MHILNSKQSGYSVQRVQTYTQRQGKVLKGCEIANIHRIMRRHVKIYVLANISFPHQQETIFPAWVSHCVVLAPQY